MLDITNVNAKLFAKRNLQFLQDIKQYKVPTVDEELLLFEMAKNGDESAKNKLFMGHQRFIYCWVIAVFIKICLFNAFNLSFKLLFISLLY